MASGSYKGAGIQVPDLLLYGILAVSGYFIYKMIVKPTSDVTGAVGDVVGSAGGAVSEGFDAFKAGENFIEQGFNFFSGQFEKLGERNTVTNYTIKQPPQGYTNFVSNGGETQKIAVSTPSKISNYTRIAPKSNVYDQITKGYTNIFDNAKITPVQTFGQKYSNLLGSGSTSTASKISAYDNLMSIKI